MAAPYKVLSVTASTGRVAYVYLEDGTPVHWGISRIAAQNTQNAARIVQSWIDDCSPDLMISEDPKSASRKGVRVRSVLGTIADLCEKSDGLNIRLTRTQSYQNKYEEAKALAKTYPQLKWQCPTQPPIWMPEPRKMSYFEALSFVEQIKAHPTS